MSATIRSSGARSIMARRKRGLGAVLGAIRALYAGSLSMYTNGDFINEIVERRILWKRSFLVNAPDVIHHVLLDNAENYARSPTESRLFRSLLGQGLITHVTFPR